MTTEQESKRKSAFVVSPIGSPGSDVARNADLALTYIFKKALDPAAWHVHRADDGEKPDSIGHHVIRSIVEADLVIADLTGHNPNVFYELAVAHGFRKPVVHLITEGQKIPFDLTDQRTISYDLTDPASVDSAIRRLGISAAAALADPSDLITPLTSFDSFDTLRHSLREKTDGDALADVLEQITDRMAALESRIARLTQPSRRADWDNRGNMSKNSGVVADEVRRILDTPALLDLFLEGKLTDQLPLAVLHNVIRRLNQRGTLDFDPANMTPDDIELHLMRNRRKRWDESVNENGD